MEVEPSVAQDSPRLGSAGFRAGLNPPKGFSNPNNSIISTSKGTARGILSSGTRLGNTSATAAVSLQEINSELCLKV